ncbi:efflux RND transporter periplasmic adaptor subunit [Candidatus Endoriftia persephone]|uniref:Efflux transporter, RND family, MFP subunit n=3 Tax=Gammaproteobacteria TaxID=1236 RepID=G2FCX5_9GAMM|nr:HlyD family efflux transporter periplasmic adaptor subunit [Candidatus Endoriftia persephone]EGV51881.1 efflux transporter, RND family, MFP subunit [endosymbiont of Riftia pachyptila (vent Ph05)]EGW55355.1 efflux transporter, RND family, MFP subunit [endosymbiont of Tevnia jerichonana (vent Tica)]USF88868.1 HlyD family efflux transporter periplasmic adaptor subunit [Candidatus Endoriftia persephone]
MLAKRLITALPVLLLPLAGCEQSPQLQSTTPVRGEIRASFTEPAQTRLARDYPISMPLDGRIGPIRLQPGDRVKKGEQLVAIDRLPFEQAVVEARAAVAELQQQLLINAFNRIEATLSVELQATIDAAREALRAADAQVESQQVRAAWADKVEQRNRELDAEGSVSQQQLDDTVLTAQTAQIELKQEEFIRAALNTLFTAIQLGPKYVEQWLQRKQLSREVIVEQLNQARARLARAEHQLTLAQLRAPVDGVVLHRHESGPSSFPAGHPLLEIGNFSDLEVVAELLTEDAMQLEPGALVEFSSGIAKRPISGRIKRIEPAAFTKRSSLGVEQQRVRVIASLDQVPATLGVGFRLQGRFFTGISHNTLILPRFSVLQATDGSHYVLRNDHGRLHRQPVIIGLHNDRQLEILEGLSDGESIVALPDADMEVETE